MRRGLRLVLAAAQILTRAGGATGTSGVLGLRGWDLYEAASPVVNLTAAPLYDVLACAASLAMDKRDKRRFNFSVVVDKIVEEAGRRLFALSNGAAVVVPLVLDVGVGSFCSCESVRRCG